MARAWSISSMAERACADDAQFHVVSLSARTIGYKAMAAPGRLRDVFADLRRELDGLKKSAFA